METKHLRGLDDDLNRGIKYNKKHGGVSDALKRIKKRPETRRDGYCFMGDIDPELQSKNKPWNWKPKK